MHNIVHINIGCIKANILFFKNESLFLAIDFRCSVSGLRVGPSTSLTLTFGVVIAIRPTYVSLDKGMIRMSKLKRESM